MKVTPVLVITNRHPNKELRKVVTLNRKTLRSAWKQAADHLAANPDSYNFMTVSIPRSTSKKERACLLGWWGHFLGAQKLAWQAIVRDLSIALGTEHLEWVTYDRFDHILSRLSASEVAAQMRKFDPVNDIVIPALVEAGIFE